MTDMTITYTGASSITWEVINWPSITRQVHQLQMRIAKAEREGRQGKVKALQWLLTHSFAAKALAVKRITQNQGGKTPGIDNVVWETPQQKMTAVKALKRYGYKPKPLKRIYIPKKDGRQRPLSIPTMLCRAQQALHLLALEPIAEMRADANSYGFRPKRSAADAIEQSLLALAKRDSAKWILEADIEACFDKISHSWLKENIPMDKRMLNKWLTAGYIDQKTLYRTTEGTPQGSTISPTLLNLTLSGLEGAIKQAARKRHDKVNVIRYADDFIITGATRELLEEKIKPVVVEFLKRRGLTLSQRKTTISHIDKGFDFLGFTIRKYNGKFLTKPSKASIKAFRQEIRRIVKSNPTAKTETLIRLLNPKIQGWGNYFCHSSAKRIFGSMTHYIFKTLWRWIKRRHSRKGAWWCKQKYFRCQGFRNWVFSTKVVLRGKPAYLDLVEMSYIPIKRHIKIRATATPYDPMFNEYFIKRYVSMKIHRHQVRKEAARRASPSIDNSAGSSQLGLTEA